MDELIVAVLSECDIKHGWAAKLGEPIESLVTVITKAKSDWLTIHDVYMGIHSIIGYFIREEFKEPDELNGTLKDIFTDEQFEDLKNRLSVFFQSIPRRYKIQMPLPSSQHLMGKGIEFTDSIKLELTENKVIPKGEPTLMGLSSLFERSPECTLAVNSEGFSSFTLDSYSAQQALGIFKIFIQQGLQRELYELNEASYGGLRGLMALTNHEVPRASFKVEDIADKRTYTIELPIDLCILLSKLSIKDPARDLMVRIQNALGSAAKLVSARHEGSERVKAACQWYFDSLATENQSLSFLQICFGFEALLGDGENKAGLTETLADRCAFLIGDSIQGRTSIKKNFKELYKLRSKLVHGVANNLDSENVKYLYWGRKILNLAISKEIKHLKLPQ